MLISCPHCEQKLRLKDRDRLGRRARCPGCRRKFVVELPSSQPGTECDSTSQIQASQTEAGEQPLTSSGSAFSDVAAPPLGVGASPESGSLDQLSEIRRRSQRRRRTSFVVATIITGLVAAASVGAMLYVRSAPSASARPSVASSVTTTADRVSAASPTDLGEAATETSRDPFAHPPTHGEPIQLRLLPFGANVVINVHASELWRAGSLGDEVRQCLGPLGAWCELRLEELCLYEPAQIEEALICLMFGSPGHPPQIAGVVRLTEPRDRSELAARFGGRRIPGDPAAVYMVGERAYLIDDERTFAFGPVSLAGEMVDAAQSPSLPAASLRDILPLTDRKRHLTVVFDPADARRHSEHMAPNSVRSLLMNLFDWLEPNRTAAVVWSIHLDEYLRSEILLRNRRAADERVLTSRMLEQTVSQKLDALPSITLKTVRQMNPQAAGRRQVIGRFPAMIKAVAMATRLASETRLVGVVTALPERAAPNLALAALLTWDESRRTIAASGESVTAETAESLSTEPVAEVLDRQLEFDIRRMPLEEALQFIGGEIGVTAVLDGDGLKLAGLTKNMPQSFNMGAVSARAAIKAIVEQYEGMVIVVDEKKRTITVTTKAAAEKKGLTPFALTP